MSWKRAVVIGASGGIGGAIAKQLEARDAEVHALSRSAVEAANRIDIEDEASIASAAKRVGLAGEVDLVFVASGLLHGSGIEPEKAWRDLSPEKLAKSFAINATGPALVAKHFLPLLSREGRAAFAALSARVGSISDNRLGGWYGYRASKAALNMLVKSLSIELARSRPDAFCIALHPGTVDTALSKPFQRNLKDGQLTQPVEAASHLLTVLDQLDAASSGKIFAWDGQEIDP